MKKTCLFLFLFMQVLILAAAVQSKSKVDKTIEETKAFRDIQNLVESRQFQIEIDRVFPQNGLDVSRFNPQGEIIVRDSVAQGYLPFFGEAYILPYGSAGGIKFDNVMNKVKSKTIEKKKKKMVSIQFSIRGEDDVFQMIIESMSSGDCFVRVVCNKREQISYGGKIAPIKKAEILSSENGIANRE